MVEAFLQGVALVEAEVMDIDETAFRNNRLDAQPYGFLLVPEARDQLQRGKEGSPTTPETVENKRDIAAAFVEQMQVDVLYLLGPGTTVQAIADALGVSKTLLGIDAVYDGEVVGLDLNERALQELLSRYPRREIVVTPLGGNGFIFGRGNKPFTPQILREVGRDHITVVATEAKMREVGVLRVDTGDPEVDADLAGYIEVATGYNVARVARVCAT
jgi:predicted polyphosphate/ATP-dependent NAD kinase